MLWIEWSLNNGRNPLFSALRGVNFETNHDDVIKWKYFPRYWPFVWGFHRLPVNSPHKGQWRGTLMLSLICAWTNGLVSNRDAGDLRRHHAHYHVTNERGMGVHLRGLQLLWRSTAACVWLTRPWFNIKMPSTCIWNSIVEIRQSYDPLISTVELPLSVRCHLYIESGPWAATSW